MKVIDNIIVPGELDNLCFECDVEKCRGACCVEGDAGAPLTEEEIGVLEDYLTYLKPFMEPEGRRVAEVNGVFDWDMDGNYVTPLVNDRECVFATFTAGRVAVCAIEICWNVGLIPLRKPESCHLYPLRIVKMENGMEKLFYHRWPICEPALQNGKSKKVKLSTFLKDALISKYGREWYERL